MPRKAPDKVIEHRISMSNFERGRLDEMITTYQAKSTANTITNLIGSVSLPMLGVAALIWVGFSLDDFIEDTKSWAKRQGNSIADYLTSTGIINYTADEIGRAITETEEEKQRMYAEMIAFYNAPEIFGVSNFDSKKGKRYRKDMEALETRDQILRKMLNDIATGNTEGMGKVGWVLQPSDSDKDKQTTADLLQSWYEMEGGEGEISWDVDGGDTLA